MSKIRLRRKIRRLAGVQKQQTAARWTTSILLLFLMVLIGCATSFIYINSSGSVHILESFIAAYRKHYYQIISGDPNYCRRSIDTSQLFKQLINENSIINQNAALNELSLAFKNESKLTAIAIVGPSGVGKSLFATALRQNFPWKENIQIYSWCMYVKDNESRRKAVYQFTENIWDCGQNLIIIDDLSVEDKQFIEDYAENIKNSTLISGKVIIIYIVNLPSYTAKENKLSYDLSYNISQTIRNVEIINFRNFSNDDIKDCIRREANEANLTLSNDAFQEILNSIDAARSGCKNVYSKVLMHGKRN